MHVRTLEGNVVIFRVYHSFLLRNILRGIALQQMDTDTVIEQPSSNTYHITSPSVRRLRKLEMCLLCFLLTKRRGTWTRTVVWCSQSQGLPRRTLLIDSRSYTRTRHGSVTSMATPVCSPLPRWFPAPSTLLIGKYSSSFLALWCLIRKKAQLWVLIPHWNAGNSMTL